MIVKIPNTKVSKCKYYAKKMPEQSSGTNPV